MEDLTIAGLAGGAVLIIRETVAAVAAAYKDRGAPQIPPPASEGGATSLQALQGELTVVRNYLDELRKWAIEESKDSVLDAQSRKAVLDISDALQALVLHIDRDRRDTERDRETAAKDRAAIMARLDQATKERTEIIDAIRRLERRLP